MTLTIDLPDNLSERLREEARRNGTDEAGFTRRALEERLGEESPLESLPEISLIERINAQGFDATFWQRYRELATLSWAKKLCRKNSGKSISPITTAWRRQTFIASST